MRRFIDKKSIVALLAIVANVLYMFADTSSIAESWYVIVAKVLAVLGYFTCDAVIECHKSKDGDDDGEKIS